MVKYDLKIFEQEIDLNIDLTMVKYDIRNELKIFNISNNLKIT